jgi:hypothetical protein
MNKPLVIGLSLVGCGGILVGALSIRHAANSTASAAPAQLLPQQHAAPQPIDSSTRAVTPLKDWQRLPQMPSEEQARYATRVMTEPGWAPEMRAGLLGQLANRYCIQR